MPPRLFVLVINRGKHRLTHRCRRTASFVHSLAKLPTESHKSERRLGRVIGGSVHKVWSWREAFSCLVNAISGLHHLHLADPGFAVCFWHI